MILYCVFFIQRIQACDTKIGRPKKKVEICQTQKIAEIFVKPRKIAKKFANPEK